MPPPTTAPVAEPPLRHASVWNLPNGLTLSRLGLAFVLFACISYEAWWLGLIVFAVAAFTDWLDGYLARLQGLTSAFGRNFDPLVDKVLICGAFIYLLPVGPARLQPWMVTLVVGRELVITGLRGYLENCGATFGADWLGKFKMVLQCAYLIAVLAVLAMPGQLPAGDWLLIGCLVAMLAATALSGLQYLWKAIMFLKTS